MENTVLSFGRWSRFLLLFVMLPGAAALMQRAVAQSASTLSLMPMPSSVQVGSGEFAVDGSLAVRFEGFKEPRLDRARERFLTTLRRETGIPFLLDAPESSAKFVVHTDGPSQVIEKLGEDESYSLRVSADGVQLKAANPLGVLHGLQTFLQLVRITPQGFSAPAVTIEDKPRFPWRGLMIDVGRHFIPLPVIERNLDAMEAVKLNVFHWHLSDDQGFRVESKVFPLLQMKGSNGFYYTQEQIEHVVEYARDRGIRVVPEFDMPAHATAWFAGYPNLASGKGPYEIGKEWGVLDPAMDPTRESTYQFLNLFIGEMTRLFPDEYFHVGGDECNGKEWDANPKIQEFKQAHNLKDNAALQAYFSGRVQKIVASHHRIMEGWDEVLQPDTPKDVVIQSWRGRKSLLDAAQRGYRGLLSNGYYIDLNQPASEHYLVDPLEGIQDKLTPEQAASILGGEATMWSEFVDGGNVDSRIWPRTAGIAERYWSPASVKDVPSMYARMNDEAVRLRAYGIDPKATEEQMLERLSGDDDPVALRVLASVVQPPKGYEREGLKHNDTSSPLNHLIDAVPPESETAREFAVICKRIADGSASENDVHTAKQWLTLWRDNDAKLQPELGRTYLTQELVPLSQSLHTVAEIGLDALDRIERKQPMPTAMQSEEVTTLQAAAKPQAVLLLKVAPPVEELVKAVPAQ